MPSYLVESYAPGRAAAEQRERAKRAAELGTGVRYLRTTFLPGDETVLHAFEASSPEALREAAHAAELAFERIVESVEGSSESACRHKSGVSGSVNSRPAVEEGRNAPVPELSLTEERIVRLLTEGLSKAEITEAVGLDERTVDWHLERATRKLERVSDLHQRLKGGSTEASPHDERKECTDA
jgi:DNA-binding NarL/FixJ family response regulator